MIFLHYSEDADTKLNTVGQPNTMMYQSGKDRVKMEGSLADIQEAKAAVVVGFRDSVLK